MRFWTTISDYSWLLVLSIALQVQDISRWTCSRTLSNWVEHGNAPEQLTAQIITEIDPATGSLASGKTTTHGRPLCRYPLVQKYIGGDPDVQLSFECVKE